MTRIPARRLRSRLLPAHLLPALVLLTGLVLAPATRVQPAAAADRTASASAPVSAAAPVSVRVVGSTLVDGAGHALRLRGVNRSGTEFACAQGWGLFDGPTDTAAVAAIASWGVNAVRVPLNQSCWLGGTGVPVAFAGAAYRDAVAGFVQRLHAAGLVVVLDLHWNAPGGQRADGQQVMADDGSVPFWSSVAAFFRTDPGVVFDLYNEPHDISWQCWRDGCTTAAGWHAAGMQALLDAVRATGAGQPVLVGGMNWAGDLSQWLTYRPRDPAGQLGASAHIYNFSQCNTAACWDATVGQVARVVPVVTGELGSDDCAPGFVTSYMDWADAHGVGYLGWTWNTWDCRTGPALITSYDGTPTLLGAALRARLLAGVPPAGAPSGGAPRILYDFERGTAPWRPETPGATVSPVARAHSGAAGLQVGRPALTASTALLRLNDGGNTIDPAAGGLLTAWVRIPPDAPGTDWCAALQLQDAAWSWHGDTCLPLVPGSWTRLAYRPAQDVWPGHGSVGIEVRSRQTGTGALRAVIDDIRQSA